jgi:hypothetical protein
MAIQRLTAAYRSRSRPSSTLGAKASTMCPYYLDGDLDENVRRPHPVIPTSLATVQFSRSVKRLERPPPPRDRGPLSAGEAPVSQNSTACAALARANGTDRPAAQIRSTCLVTECAQSFGRAELQGARASASGIRCPRIGGLPRKEVIQPQLPLRLPCYDFTPVTSPTFDGSLPKGLGHRLRVLLTPMV